LLDFKLKLKKGAHRSITHQIDGQHCCLDILVDVLMDNLPHGSGSGSVAHLAQADLSHVEPLRLDTHPGKVAPYVLEEVNETLFTSQVILYQRYYT